MQIPLFPEKQCNQKPLRVHQLSNDTSVTAKEISAKRCNDGGKLLRTEMVIIKLFH